MPINSKHPEYTEMVSKWRRCRITVEGEDSIKEAGEEFLPRLEEQEEYSYENYKTRASFYAASARTVQGIVGLVFRKEPTITGLTEEQEQWLRDIGRGGKSMETVANGTFSGVLTTNRVGVMLDLSVGESGEVLPFIVTYDAESIINWDTDNTGNLTLVVLEEQVLLKNPEDPYEKKPTTQWRELRLSSSEETMQVRDSITGEQGERVVATGTYTVNVWRKDPDTDNFFIAEQYVPDIRGRTLNFIPIVIESTEDLTAKIKKPSILDMVNVNVGHYRNSADYEHGLHFTALPTPWAAGFDTGRGQTLALGSEVAWTTSDPQAKADFLEFTGAGLKSLAEAMAKKEEQMAILGARLIEAPKRAVEAADTHRIRRAGEDSVVATAANVLSEAFTIILKWAIEWRGGAVSEDVAIEFNTDYTMLEISPQMIQTLTQGLQNGTISPETYFYNMSQGEMYPDGWTLEDELEALTNSPFVMGAGTPPTDEDEEEARREEDEEDDEEGESDEDEIPDDEDLEAA